MQFPAAFVLSVNAVRDEANSARPDAPTVPHVEESPRGRAIRSAIAGAFARAAEAIAPAQPAPATAEQRCG